MIEVIPEIGSTNAALLARHGAGEYIEEGFWLVADRQTAGRGRAGRRWTDGFGNFMGSTVANLRPGDPLPQTLALVAGIAAHRAIASVLPDKQPVLKWPNDLLLEGAKLAGVLLERQGDCVVVGIGVNIVQAPQVPDRATTCLAAHGSHADRDAFAQALVAEWGSLLAQWHGGWWLEQRSEWLARAHPLGTLISVNDAEHGRLIGAFAGLSEDGVAYLRLADGKRHAIHAGDIEMVGGDASGS